MSRQETNQRSDIGEALSDCSRNRSRPLLCTSPGAHSVCASLRNHTYHQIYKNNDGGGWRSPRPAGHLHPKYSTEHIFPRKVGTLSGGTVCRLRCREAEAMRAWRFLRGRLWRAGARRSAPLKPTSLVTFLFGDKKVTLPCLAFSKLLQQNGIVSKSHL